MSLRLFWLDKQCSLMLKANDNTGRIKYIRTERKGLPPNSTKGWVILCTAEITAFPFLMCVYINMICPPTYNHLLLLVPLAFFSTSAYGVADSLSQLYGATRGRRSNSPTEGQLACSLLRHTHNLSKGSGEQCLPYIRARVRLGHQSKFLNAQSWIPEHCNGPSPTGETRSVLTAWGQSLLLFSRPH